MRFPIARLLHLLVLCPALASVCAQDYIVLTWNIRYDNPADSLDLWDLRKEALAKEMMAHTPQIIGLQEALAHQVTYLDQHWPGYGRFGVGREDGKEKGEFSPVYYDTAVFVLIEGHTMWLSPTPEIPGKGWDAASERIATTVTLQDRSTGDFLWVVNTHWDHVGKEARAQSAEMVMSSLSPAQARIQRIVVMGDLNAEPNDGPIRSLKTPFMDSCPAELSGDGTFNGFNLDQTVFKRIDYVWLSHTNWEVLSYEVPHPMVNGRHMSDHFPVVVRLRLK